MMKRTSLWPWVLTAGTAAAAFGIWRRMVQPYYPDVALHAGLELCSRPRRVLAFGPHPTDLECWVGGTLKLLSLGGSAVTMAVLSRGETATNRANIGEIRSREAEEGAAVLGCNLVQLDLPDGAIEPGPGLDRAIAEVWRQVDPEVVLSFDPKGWLPGAVNPDHTALGAAVLARSRRAVAAGVRIYFYGAPQPNVLVDVTEVLPEKLNGLRAHRSQLVGPDWATAAWTRWFSRLQAGQVPAGYVEGLYRLV